MSLLDFSRDRGCNLELGDHDIGDVAFIGVGAVGNAAIWTLSHDITLRGSLFVADNEALALPNLQRYVLGAYKDVQKPKVRLAGRCLRHTALTVELYKKTLDEFVGTDGLKIPTVCISVDNVGARRAAQTLLPRLIINGWTGDRAVPPGNYRENR